MKYTRYVFACVTIVGLAEAITRGGKSGPEFQPNDVPNFDTENIYEQTFSPDGIANQLLQNFFNWFTSTIFWLSFVPFYTRMTPIFQQSGKRESVVGRLMENLLKSDNVRCSPLMKMLLGGDTLVDNARFGDVPNIPGLASYQVTFSPDGVAVQLIQNFFNFFVSTIFWLCYIPFYERFHPIFEMEDDNVTTTTLSPLAHKGNHRSLHNETIHHETFNDVPNFNVDNIYYQTFSPDGIAIQLLQNFFNWFTSTAFWVTYMSFTNRIMPVFSDSNNQKRDDSDWVEEPRFVGDVPSFNATDIYSITFATEGIMVQMVDNFFNFVANTMFWLAFIPFYERLSPIFKSYEESVDTFDDDLLEPAPRRKRSLRNLNISSSQFSSVLRILASTFEFSQSFFDTFYSTPDQNESEGTPRFGDVNPINLTYVYQQDFFPSGIMQQVTQNFFNFFVSSMFWLAYVPFYERLSPIFAPNHDEDANSRPFSLNDSPDFNVTNIYEQTYSPDGIAIQLIQNCFNWFTSTIFWLTILPFYSRMYAMFLPMFTRSFVTSRGMSDDNPDDFSDCDNLSLVQTIASGLRLMAEQGEKVQRYFDDLDT